MKNITLFKALITLLLVLGVASILSSKVFGFHLDVAMPIFILSFALLIILLMAVAIKYGVIFLLRLSKIIKTSPEEEMIKKANKKEAFQQIVSCGDVTFSLIKNNTQKFLVIVAIYFPTIYTLQDLLSRIMYPEEAGLDHATYSSLEQCLYSIGIIFLMLTASSLYSMALFLLVRDSNNNSYQNFKLKVKERLIPLIWANIVRYVVIIFWLLIFIVPGVVRLYRYALLDYFVIFKNNNFKEASKNSTLLTYGYKTSIFEYGALLYLALLSITIVIAIVFGYSSTLSSVIGSILTVIVNGFYALVMYQLWEINVKTKLDSKTEESNNSL